MNGPGLYCKHPAREIHGNNSKISHLRSWTCLMDSVILCTPARMTMKIRRPSPGRACRRRELIPSVTTLQAPGRGSPGQGLEKPPSHRQGRQQQASAPVAQLDRVLPSEGRGHRFESCRARHYNQPVIKPSVWRIAFVFDKKCNKSALKKGTLTSHRLFLPRVKAKCLAPPLLACTAKSGRLTRGSLTRRID